MVAVQCAGEVTCARMDEFSTSLSAYMPLRDNDVNSKEAPSKDP